MAQPVLDVNKNERSKEEYASQWQLMFLRFRKHKLAIGASVVLIVLYLSALFASFISPIEPNLKSLPYREAPPQRLHFFESSRFYLRPFVYPLQGTMNRQTYKRSYVEVRTEKYFIHFFVHGYEYKLFGFIKTDIHLFGTRDADVPVHLFGTDMMGRDVFARTLRGSQVSLTIGLVGVAISFFLGVFIGGISGLFGGISDEIIQRIIEIVTCIPQLPLWMGLSAALPTSWPVLKMYFAITLILSLVSWPGLARVVRGKFLVLREEEYIFAAYLNGQNDIQVIFTHMLPAFMSHIVASLTLAIPSMIIGETALSFLGLGMQPPAISWGVLLRVAQNVHTLSLAPWLMIPGLFVIVTVLAFNFVGDGLRDAADPYSQ